MPQTDPVLVDAARRILTSVADPQSRRSQSQSATWQALEQNGLTHAWLPESVGGAGASLADGFAILTLAGEVALDVPLAETLLAGWALAAAGIEVPTGALAPAGTEHAGIRIGSDGRLTGKLRAVPFGRTASWLVVTGGEAEAAFVALVDRAACTVQTRDNLAGEPRDTVLVDGVAPVAVVRDAAVLRDRLHSMGAVARASQMAGALQAILGRSVAYAGDREAFDRPIGKFQAIQHALARLAGEVAAALAAAGSAADALASGEPDADGVFLEVASAKIRVGEAAAAGAAIAHQVHGAIGFSTEHPLHRFTQRLWAWRDDFGSESAWAVALGARTLAWGADGLWPVIAAR